jgi:hypothetical protein
MEWGLESSPSLLLNRSPPFLWDFPFAAIKTETIL